MSETPGEIGDRPAGPQPALNTPTSPGGALRDDETGWPGRLFEVALGVGVASTVAVVLARVADVPRGETILRLELAGTAERARDWLVGRPADAVIGVSDVHQALLLDLILIAFYATTLFVATVPVASRGFRVSSWRRAAPGLRWLAVIAAGLDVLENIGIWIGTDNLGSPSWWTGVLWATVAALAWAKFAALFVAIGYVLIGCAGYVVTPPWMWPHLASRPDPTLAVSPHQALEPERVVAAAATTRTDSSDAESGGFGIAVAGGGIRSASLALGSLQALAEDPLGPNWTSAAMVTAVSGGAYMAGGYSIARSSRQNSRPPACDGANVDDEPEPPPDQWPPQPPGPCPDAWNAGSPENDFLIGHLGYLLAKNPTGERPAPRPTAAGLPDQDHGRRDVPGVLATIVLGIAFNAVLLLVPLWLAVQPLAWLVKSDVVGCDGYGDNACVTAKTAWPTTIWIVVALVLLLVWVGAGWVRGAFGPGTPLYRASDWAFMHLRFPMLGVAAVAGLMVVLLIVVPSLITATPGWLGSISDWAQPAAILAAIGAGAAALKTLARPLSRFAPQVGGLLFIAALVLLSAHWASTANFQHWDADHLSAVSAQAGSGHGWWDRWAFQAWAVVGAFPNHTWLLCLIGWLLAYLAFNPEWWAMAPFYRGKLRSAFATYRRSDGPAAYMSGNRPTATAEPSLYELDTRSVTQPDGSPLRLCATATVSGRSVKTHYGIPAMSVTFDPTTVRLNVPTDDQGGWSAYECSTAAFERLHYRRGGSRFTTMMAVGISGAAVSPAMGKFRIGPARALLAMMNVRLGVWVPNPKYVAVWRPGERPTRERPWTPGRVAFPQPRLGYLMKEVFGVHDPDDLYLYLTDGGHWENTGLVELLRVRNFSEVVCLDADAGTRDTVTQLANAVTLGTLECGIRIAVDLDPLRSPYEGRRGGDYARRAVTVGLIRRGSNHVGLLWYAKPALTRKTPSDVLSYAENDLAFPTTGTTDQFFHTAQFSAYRELGRDNAREIVAARAALKKALDAAPLWATFSKLASAEHAHWAVTTVHGLIDDAGEYTRLRELLLGEHWLRHQRATG